MRKQVEITKHLKLPFQFKGKKLLHELDTIIENQWIPHFYTQSYNGDWSSIALYAKEGKEVDIFATQNPDSAIIETPLLKKCPYLREVINHFKCPLLSVRLLKLAAGSKIKPHQDYQLGYENGNFRLHIPITTHQDVHFHLGGDRLVMLPGECWYTNVNFTHSVANNGQSDRVHLVIDGERNAWSDHLFFSLAPKESLVPEQSQDSIDTISRIIEELQNIDEPAANQLILDYQKQLERLKANQP